MHGRRTPANDGRRCGQKVGFPIERRALQWAATGFERALRLVENEARPPGEVLRLRRPVSDDKAAELDLTSVRRFRSARSDEPRAISIA
jgi:hypothetical protein